MRSASLKTNFGGSWGLLVYSFFFSLSFTLSGSSPNMSEILVTGNLSKKDGKDQETIQSSTLPDPRGKVTEV